VVVVVSLSWASLHFATDVASLQLRDLLPVTGYCGSTLVDEEQGIVLRALVANDLPSCEESVLHVVCNGCRKLGFAVLEKAAQVANTSSVSAF